MAELFGTSLAVESTDYPMQEYEVAVLNALVLA